MLESKKFNIVLHALVEVKLLQNKCIFLYNSVYGLIITPKPTNPNPYPTKDKQR